MTNSNDPKMFALKVAQDVPKPLLPDSVNLFSLVLVLYDSPKNSSVTLHGKTHYTYFDLSLQRTGERLMPNTMYNAQRWTLGIYADVIKIQSTTKVQLVT